MSRHAFIFAAVLALVATACGGSEATADDNAIDTIELCSESSTPPPELLEVGVVQEFPDNGGDHVVCPSYSQSPPVGGDHFGGWQNCGFYSTPIQDQTAVHALEHGAVWIAYDPDLATDEVDAIEDRVEADGHILAAPYPGLQNSIVLTAWTRQVAVDRVADPMFQEFINGYRGDASPTAPEPGIRCDGAIGIAPDQPNAVIG